MITKAEATTKLTQYCSDCGMSMPLTNLILTKHDFNYPNQWKTEPSLELANIGQATLELYAKDTGGVEIEITTDAPIWILMDISYA